VFSSSEQHRVLYDAAARCRRALVPGRVFEQHCVLYDAAARCRRARVQGLPEGYKAGNEEEAHAIAKFDADQELTGLRWYCALGHG
jgi:hypothetical protein